MNPLVSILIPAYNAGEWISHTIQSAMAQTWTRKEIIIVDDGSRDNTLAVARQFESSKVLVVSQPNQGAAAARNKAFSVCQGDYVQWLDADDLLSQDKLESQLSALNYSGTTNRTLLSSGWGYFMYRPQTARFTPTALWADLSPAEWLLRKLDQNLHMQTGTWLVSRQLTEQAGPWNTQLLGDDDGEYFCRVLMASDGVKFVHGPKVFYRRAPRSLSFIGRSARKIEAQFVSMRLHIDYLRSLEDSDRVRKACIKYLERYLLFFYPERPDIVQEARKLAENLGGQLPEPRLPWKYHWIQQLFGWNVGKRAWLGLPEMKEKLIRSWDKACFTFAAQGRAITPDW